MPTDAVHLGDGCYAEIVEGSLFLFTYNGYEMTNQIWLDPQVYASLLKFVESKKGQF